MARLAWTLLGIGSTAVALLLADGLSDSVTASLGGALLGAAIIAGFFLLLLVVNRTMLRRGLDAEKTALGCAAVALAFAAIPAVLPVIVIAARIAPSFETRGFWAAFLAFCCYWLVDGLIAIPRAAIRRLRAMPDGAR